MAFGGYPPPSHFLGDLGIEAEVISTSSAKVRIPVTPFITGPDGGVRAGVLAILVDVVGGRRGSAPPARLDGHRRPEPPAGATAPSGPRSRPGPTCSAGAGPPWWSRPWSSTWTHDGRRGRRSGGRSHPGGLGHHDLRHPARRERVHRGRRADLPRRAFTISGRGLEARPTRSWASRWRMPPRGRVSLPVHAYLRNSFGAVQGGIMAVLAEVAAAARLGARPRPGRIPRRAPTCRWPTWPWGGSGPSVRASVGGTDAGGGESSAARSSSSSTRAPTAGCTTVVNARGRAAVPGRHDRAARRLQVDRPRAADAPGPADLRHTVSQYFRLERVGDRHRRVATRAASRRSVAGSRIDAHHRGAAVACAPARLLTNVDSLGGFLCGYCRSCPSGSSPPTHDGHGGPASPRGPLRLHGRVLRRGRNAVVAGARRRGRGTRRPDRSPPSP